MSGGQERRKTLATGDYVLASKYHDGDPCDHFAVGYFGGMFGERFMVHDEYGRPMRANGFRRCEKVSQRVGRAIVRAMTLGVIGDIEGPSVWFWRHHPAKLESICEDRRVQERRKGE